MNRQRTQITAQLMSSEKGVTSNASGFLVGGMLLMTLALTACQPNAQRAKNTHSQGSTSSIPQTGFGADMTQLNTGPGLHSAIALETYPSGKPVPDGVRETLILLQAQYPEEKVIERIRTAPVSYRLDADEILYLNDLGVSTSVISEMVRADVHQGWESRSADQALIDLRTVDSEPLISGDTAAHKEESALDLESSEQGSTSVLLTNVESGPASEPVSQLVSGAEVEAEALQPVEETAGQISGPALDFYEPLSPYGNWVYVDQIGWCWRPTVASVSVDWAPYRDYGRWVYTDYGWYWDSYYSWGWAPFHYGRWTRHASYGWVWRPGQTWGPAWVTWRYNNAYCGWAPLPPRAHYVTGRGFYYQGSYVGSSFGFGIGYYDYTFLPYSRLHGHRVERYAVYGGRGRDIYSNSVVINNYVIGDNNTVINQGIGLKTVESRLGKGIQKTRVQMANVPVHPTQMAQAQTRRNDTIVAHRVPVNTASRPSPIPVEANSTGRSRDTTTVTRPVGERELSRSASTTMAQTATSTRPVRPVASPSSQTGVASRPSTSPVDRSGIVTTPVRSGSPVTSSTSRIRTLPSNHSPSPRTSQENSRSSATRITRTPSSSSASPYVSARRPAVRSSRPSVTPDSRPARTITAPAAQTKPAPTPAPRPSVSTTSRPSSSSVGVQTRSGGFQTRSTRNSTSPQVSTPSRSVAAPTVRSPQSGSGVSPRSSSAGSTSTQIRVSPSRFQSRPGISSGNSNVSRPVSTPSPGPSPAISSPARRPSSSVSTPSPRPSQSTVRSGAPVTSSSASIRTPSRGPATGSTSVNSSRSGISSGNGGATINVNRGGFQSQRGSN